MTTTDGEKPRAPVNAIGYSIPMEHTELFDFYEMDFIEIGKPQSFGRTTFGWIQEMGNFERLFSG